MPRCAGEQQPEGRGGARGGVGAHGVERGQRIGPGGAGDPPAGAGGDRRAGLPPQPRGAQPPGGPYRHHRPGDPGTALPYFAELAGLLVDEARRRSWTVVIDQTRGGAEAERRLLTGDGGRVMDGLIISPWPCPPRTSPRPPARCPWCCSASAVRTGWRTGWPWTTWPPPTRPRRICCHWAAAASPRSAFSPICATARLNCAPRGTVRRSGAPGSPRVSRGNAR